MPLTNDVKTSTISSNAIQGGAVFLPSLMTVGFLAVLFMKSQDKTLLFESVPIPHAVITLSLPTMISSLVMVLYNLADTYFVGMINDPIQNAAVTLAAPVLLAFNAVNNLFGVGSSSMMSRALGRNDRETVSRSSAFGFYAALLCGILFCLPFGNPGCLCWLWMRPTVYLSGDMIFAPVI